MNDIKDMLKERSWFSQDDERRAELDVQEAHRTSTSADVEALLAAKEKEVMQV